MATSKHFWVARIGVALCLIQPTPGIEKHADYLSPTSLASSPDGKKIFIACATGNQVMKFDVATSKITRRIHVGTSPSGLAMASDGWRLYVTCAAPASTVTVIDTGHGEVCGAIPVGHTAIAPVLHPDGKTLYVCNRFDNDVSVVDLATWNEVARVPVRREPVGAAIASDGKYLLVANHLHDGRADRERVASTVTVISTAMRRVVKHIDLPNGSGLLRGICISPDGRYACVTHLLSRFQLPTTQVDRGWINSNALTLIDLLKLEALNTVLLDNIDRGAANPWACAWTADGKQIVVTHAGTHEVSVIDAHGLLAKLNGLGAATDPDTSHASRTPSDVPNDLSFLVGLRRRISLPERDRGPRAVCLVSSNAYIANYFSDTISVVAYGSDSGSVVSQELNADSAGGSCTLERKGEFYFNDASICFQGWQSCASCHSSDARVDGLNWDNLNDGIGNPKNAKSLLLAHETPPSMWLGVRSNASVAVRAGIKNSMFTVQSPDIAEALDAYLKSLRPLPSPYLQKGRLSPAAVRGKELFFSETTGCAQCHRGPSFTDQKLHNTGTQSACDRAGDKFDTPTLIEAWRTAPYLHDGSAATVRDVLTTRNLRQQHGDVKKLTAHELSDLVQFVLSL